MIIEVIVLSGIFGVGYSIFKEEETRFEKQVLDTQKKRNSALKKKLHVEKATLAQPERTVSASQPHASGPEIQDVIMPTRALSRSPRDLVILGGALGVSSFGALVYAPAALLAPPLVLYAARRRFLSAFSLLRQGRFGVETISSLSILGAMVAGHFVIGSLLGLINGLGDYLSSKVIKESKNDLTNLFEDIPKTVWLLKDGVEVSIPLDSCKPGDVLVVCAGEVVPADGHIIWGAAGIDQQRFTGEAAPVEKSENDEVFAMTLVLSGKIHVKIEKAGDQTSAMQIARILKHTADYKSNTVLEAQALSRKLVVPALVSSGIAWPFFGFSAAVGILFAHPKERIQVSAPISLLTYLKYSMKEGMLIKDGRSLELLNKVDTIVFDKTGTLTEEVPKVATIHSFKEDVTENEILAWAALAEYRQTHPLAKAILTAAADRNLPIQRPDHTEIRLGYGVKATLGSTTVAIGSPRFMEAEGVVLPDAVMAVIQNCECEGGGAILVALNDQFMGAIELVPTPRAEAKAIIAALKKLPNIKQICIISGDQETPTRKLAHDLGIDSAFARVLPEQKAATIEKMQQRGQFVCFVGDGVNDAIAMKQAQVSISLIGASKLATDTAQIVLLDQGISHLPRLFELARRFKKHMRRQYAMIIVPSMIGAGMITLSGWGMVYVMYMNMGALALTLGNALLERPQAAKLTAKPPRQHHLITAKAMPLQPDSAPYAAPHIAIPSMPIVPKRERLPVQALAHRSVSKSSESLDQMRFTYRHNTSNRVRRVSRGILRLKRRAPYARR